jgi:hypothetical protein
MSAIHYTEELTCECTPCPACEGEGEHVRYRRYYHGGGREIVTTCETCKGSGKNDDDCAVHGPLPAPADHVGGFDPKWGVTARDLGIEDDSVCIACAAGDHEMPKLAACACACHGERKAAA